MKMLTPRAGPTPHNVHLFNPFRRPYTFFNEVQVPAGMFPSRTICNLENGHRALAVKLAGKPQADVYGVLVSNETSDAIQGTMGFEEPGPRGPFLEHSDWMGHRPPDLLQATFLDGGVRGHLVAPSQIDLLEVNELRRCYRAVWNDGGNRAVIGHGVQWWGSPFCYWWFGLALKDQWVTADEMTVAMIQVEPGDGLPTGRWGSTSGWARRHGEQVHLPLGGPLDLGARPFMRAVQIAPAVTDEPLTEDLRQLAERGTVGAYGRFELFGLESMPWGAFGVQPWRLADLGAHVPLEPSLFARRRGEGTLYSAQTGSDDGFGNVVGVRAWMDDSQTGLTELMNAADGQTYLRLSNYVEPDWSPLDMTKHPDSRSHRYLLAANGSDFVTAPGPDTRRQGENNGGRNGWADKQHEGRDASMADLRFRHDYARIEAVATAGELATVDAQTRNRWMPTGRACGRHLRTIASMVNELPLDNLTSRLIVHGVALFELMRSGWHGQNVIALGDFSRKWTCVALLNDSPPEAAPYEDVLAGVGLECFALALERWVKANHFGSHTVRGLIGESFFVSDDERRPASEFLDWTLDTDGQELRETPIDARPLESHLSQSLEQAIEAMHGMAYLLLRNAVVTTFAYGPSPETGHGEFHTPFKLPYPLEESEMGRWPEAPTSPDGSNFFDWVYAGVVLFQRLYQRFGVALQDHEVNAHADRIRSYAAINPPRDALTSAWRSV